MVLLLDSYDFKNNVVDLDGRHLFKGAIGLHAIQAYSAIFLNYVCLTFYFFFLSVKMAVSQ